MTDFLEDWASESEINKKICLREDLIIDVTEDLLIALEDKGISKAELAKRLSKSKSFVTQTLSGVRNMTLRTLADFCYALELKPSISLKDITTRHCINGEHKVFNWETEVNDLRPGKVLPFRHNKSLVFPKNKRYA
jgi:transcriptional regulator with XRE-family HTH domain